ncbi:MAG: (2Fe-2S)-binding protein [Anaerolineae bacterium]
MKRYVQLTVNGEAVDLVLAPNRTLLEVLREDLGLIGTKQGCDTGECGACTILLDGAPVNACLTLAMLAEGRQITTIEGLGSGERLTPLQLAFHEYGAVQCGYCTPGMILAATALLAQNPHPTPGEVTRALSGNLCRCTGYVKVLEAVRVVAERNGERQEAAS